MNIRFSVLMPAYNREKYVGQAIDSVLSQTFKDFELFVIDDGSTDKTLQVLESYGARIKVAEVPPGPPVLETLVAEVYGPSMEGRIGLARQMLDLFKKTNGVDANDRRLYHLVLDSTVIPHATCIELIVQAAGARIVNADG